MQNEKVERKQVFYLAPPDPIWDPSKRIDDTILIEWFTTNYTQIKFLNFKVHGRIPSQVKKLKKEIGELKSDKELSLQKDQLLKIWDLLIGSAIVYLKSKDKREKHHDDEDYGVSNLSKFFRSYTDFESVFYGADKHYRDHVSHMFKVFLLGELLLTEKKLFAKIQIGELFLDEKFKILDEEKEAVWCIISLTHDLGYGMRLVPNINKKTRSMLEKFDIFDIHELGFPFPNQPFNEFVIKIASSELRELTENEKELLKKKDDEKKPPLEDRRKYVNHIQSKYLLKFSRSFDHFSHGIFSSILLVKNCIYFLERDFSRNLSKPLNQLDARNFLIRQTILRSIASHDCDEIYYLTLPQFPFLLRIIDEMQDWGRPGLSDLFKHKPEIDLFVDKLDDANISYRCVYRNNLNAPLDAKDKKEFNDIIKAEFIRKCEIFRKILRSAVGGELRKLILTFTVVDLITEPKKDQITYSFIHTNPKDVKVKIKIKNSTKILSWSQFIETEERNREENKQFIDDIQRALRTL
jgi:hypothetical protein